MTLLEGFRAGTNVARDGTWWDHAMAIYPPGSVLRWVMMPDVDLTPELRESAERGFLNLPVFAKESANHDDSDESLRYWAGEYMQRYAGLIHGVQGGNEWEHHSPSSWYMNPSQLRNLLVYLRNAMNAQNMKHLPLILGGAVSGDAAQLDKVRDFVHQLCAAIAVHPYGQRAYDHKPAPSGNFGYVGQLLARYRERTHLPILVTEFGVTTKDGISEAEQAEYVSDMHRALHELRVPVAVQFCTHPYEGFGLYNEDHKPAKALVAVQLVMRDLYPATTPPKEGEEKRDTMPKFQRGFATKAKELKGAAGDPLEDEHEAVHNGHRIVHQLTTAGEFVWHEKQNMVHFYPSAVKAPAVAPPKPTTPTVPGELNIEWVGTPNFSDRRGAKPHVIVIHTAVGSLVGMNGWFNSPKNKETSAHYGIGLDGKTVQYVKEEMAAHANGIKTPENRWPFPGWPNGNTISIETADNGRPETEPVTAQQYAAVLKLCRSIMGRHNITHLAGHRVIDTGRSCPGARWVNTGLLSKLADELNLPLLI